jgi:hypothetical protein
LITSIHIGPYRLSHCSGCVIGLNKRWQSIVIYHGKKRLFKTTREQMWAADTDEKQAAQIDAAKRILEQ